MAAFALLSCLLLILTSQSLGPCIQVRRKGNQDKRRNLDAPLYPDPEALDLTLRETSLSGSVPSSAPVHKNKRHKDGALQLVDTFSAIGSA